MELLADSLGTKHRFSSAYVPWSNGTVESVCKQVLCVIRAFSAAFRIPEAEWPSTVPAIQSIINNSPSRRLGNRAPITVHTGMEPGNPLNLALTNLKIIDSASVDKARAMQALELEPLLEALDDMHKNVNAVLSESRKKAVERHNRKTHIRACNPSVGDYVVVSRDCGPRTKMFANWVGPRRIVRILSYFTFKVEHLLTEETSDVHVTRIRPYVDALVGTPVQMKEIAEFSDRIWYSVDKVKDVRMVSDNYEALVSWKGTSTASDSWEPLTILFEDVPTKVREFFKRRRANATTRKATASLGL